MVYQTSEPRLTPAAAELAEQWRALGQRLDDDDAEELAQRIERDKVAELYLDALQTSVAIKRRRQTQRAERRDMKKKGQSRTYLQ